jgi:hypothetical protein
MRTRSRRPVIARGIVTREKKIRGMEARTMKGRVMIVDSMDMFL